MDHVRIDEGVERGPRSLPAPWPTRKPAISGKLGPNFDAMTVVERYLEGEEIAEIAETLNVHPKALNYHLLKPAVRDAWREAQVAVSLAEYLEAKKVIRDSSDALSLARAREILRSSQWDLERLENRLFGQKQEITHNVADDLADRLMRARERLTGAVVTPTQQDAVQQTQVIDVTPEQLIMDGGSDRCTSTT